MSEVLLINQVLQDSNLALLHQEGNERFYEFKHSKNTLARVYILELSNITEIGAYIIIYIVRQDKLVYVNNFAKKASYVESFIESYLNDEGLLEWKFPYGNLGVNNNLTKWFTMKNNKLICNTRFGVIHHRALKYNKWLQISGSFGE